MSKRILLLEPYGEVADVKADLLDQLDYVADVETSGQVDEHDLRSRGYHCVLVNLDQNRTDWRDYGLRLATLASGLGNPVVMIPDHETAAKTIEKGDVDAQSTSRNRHCNRGGGRGLALKSCLYASRMRPLKKVQSDAAGREVAAKLKADAQGNCKSEPPNMKEAPASAGTPASTQSGH